MSTASIFGSETIVFHFAITNGEKPMQFLPGLWLFYSIWEFLSNCSNEFQPIICFDDILDLLYVPGV